jgi:multidrug efflux pump subunit AcrB
VLRNRKNRGLATQEALIEAGRTRLRPILMTATATILALVPLALGFNQGAIIAADLATVVIGGLFTSTMLTLLVVPVMFSLLDRFTRVKVSGEK